MSLILIEQQHGAKGDTLPFRHSSCPASVIHSRSGTAASTVLTQTVSETVLSQYRHFVTPCSVAYQIRHYRALTWIQFAPGLSQTPLVPFGTFAYSVIVYLELDTLTPVTSRSLNARQTKCLSSGFGSTRTTRTTYYFD